MHDLRLPQANTAYYQIILRNEDGTEYTLQPEDIVYFTVRKFLPKWGESKTQGIVIQKELVLDDYSSGKLILKLLPKDTDVPTGRYLYDVAVKMEGGDQFTVIETGYFVIVDSLTDWKGGVSDEVRDETNADS